MEPATKVTVLIPAMLLSGLTTHVVKKKKDIYSGDRFRQKKKLKNSDPLKSISVL